MFEHNNRCGGCVVKVLEVSRKIKKLMYYLTGVLMLCLFITTTCHAQTTDKQNIRVEATIGPWNASSNNNGNGADTKEKPNITIPSSNLGSSSKLPQTGEQVRVYTLLLGLMLSLFSLVMLFNVNREKEREYVI